MFKTPLLDSNNGTMLTADADDDNDDANEETALLINQAIKHDEHKTRNKGGLSKKMPHRGYCLVFNKGDMEKDKYTVYQDKDTLMKKYIDKHDNEKEKNLLPNFIECNIKYYIHQTKQYYFVIISIDDEIIEEWADNVDYEIPIDPVNAIRIGRDISNEFDLAHNTFVESLDGEEGT